MKFTHKIRSATTKGFYIAGQMPTVTRIVSAGAWQRVRQGRPLTREQLVDLTGRFILDRPLNPSELDYFTRVIEEKGLSPWALPFSFFRLPNQLERRFLNCLAFHNCVVARLDLIQNHIPAAQEILDVGGAVDHHPEGALLASGYPHRAKKITIIDLPDEEREFAREGSRPQDMVTASGTEVKYVFSNMLKLGPFADESFDLVWSGQSIEHVTQSEADLLLNQVRRVLRPGGLFCLDTPNRALTRLISKRFLHPDHKFEYTPDLLEEKIKRAGFEIEERLAITPLPKSAALKRVSKLEILQEARVNEDYRNGFSFYFKCRKVTNQFIIKNPLGGHL